MSLFRKFFLEQPDFAAASRPLITLLYAAKPALDPYRLPNALADLEPLAQPAKVKVEADWETDRHLLAECTFDNHIVQIAGFAAPLPESVVEATILPSPWETDFKELLQSHTANVVLAYAGAHEDPIEQYLALYKTAACLADDTLLGVVNEPAMTCHPAFALDQIMEMLPVCRQSPPLVYWAGFLHALLGHDHWVFSRGFHLFGAADLAYHIEPGVDVAEVHEVFHEIFHYCYFNKKELQAGDALNVAPEVFYVFHAPDDDQKAMERHGRLLILERANLEGWDDLNVETYA